MPVIKQDSILNEYSFSQQEEVGARILSPLQIAWLQNKYAVTFKQKAATIVPSEQHLDRDYFLVLGELEGRLSMLQELFMEHQQAMKELESPEFKENLQQNGSEEVAGLAARASKQVDQNSISF